MLDKIKITSHEYLTDQMAECVSALEKTCMDHDGTTLKLELDYKLACAREAMTATDDKNEFLAWLDDQLVGYIGICSFGGSTMEVSGMVDPAFRKQGIFKTLFKSVKEEWLKRSTLPMLILTDRKSVSGQAFARNIGAVHEHSEYEMILDTGKRNIVQNIDSIRLRKATNSDAEAVSLQNAIYFGESMDKIPLVMPEVEEKRGLTIYIAEVEQNVIGKVNLQKIGDIGAIYGLGILPEFRGRGLGRTLLLKAIEAFKLDHIDKVMLQVEAMNDTALSLYLSCGFEMTSTMDYFELNKVE